MTTKKLSNTEIAAILLSASSCPQKLTDASDFKQVWFTRPEVEKALILAVAKLENSVEKQNEL